MSTIRRFRNVLALEEVSGASGSLVLKPVAASSNGAAYKIRRVLAGAGVSVAETGDNLTIAVTNTSSYGTIFIQPKDVLITGPWSSDDPLVTASDVNRSISTPLVSTLTTIAIPTILYRGKSFSGVSLATPVKLGYLAAYLNGAIGGKGFRFYITYVTSDSLALPLTLQIQGSADTTKKLVCAVPTLPTASSPTRVELPMVAASTTMTKITMPDTSVLPSLPDNTPKTELFQITIEENTSTAEKADIHIVNIEFEFVV